MEPSMSITPPTPDEIRAFRKEVMTSQAGLGEHLGASKRTVEDWEAGRREPPAMLRLALAALKAGLAPWGVVEHRSVQDRDWRPIATAPIDAEIVIGQHRYGPMIWLSDGHQEARGHWHFPVEIYDGVNERNVVVGNRWEGEDDKPLSFAPTFWAKA
jgi:DNA-binding XRE family transcriptional regulator